jgi:nucleoside-diphosphate-sugar epimerase
LAGYAHADDADEQTSVSVHRRVTVRGTANLLNEAAGAGVRRFVFASSVKAMGEGGGEQLDENGFTEPLSPYGRAKREAEALILAEGMKGQMQVCIVRLPLVYGPGARGNLQRMISGIDRGRFPPLPRLANRRSMVHVEDAASALTLVAEHPLASGRIYIATDGRVYSTRELYEWICSALGKSTPGWTVPLIAWRTFARMGTTAHHLFGIRPPFDVRAFEKLFGSAWYSCEKIRSELGFSARRALPEALAEMVGEYRGAAFINVGRA